MLFGIALQDQRIAPLVGHHVHTQTVRFYLEGRNLADRRIEMNSPHPVLGVEVEFKRQRFVVERVV